MKEFTPVEDSLMDQIINDDGDKVIQGDSKYGKVVARVDGGGYMTACAGAVYILLM